MNAKANNTTDKVRKLQRKLYISAKGRNKESVMRFMTKCIPLPQHIIKKTETGHTIETKISPTNSFDMIPNNRIMTHNRPPQVVDNYFSLYNQVVKLKEEKGKNIWLFGGAGVADTFIRANAVDEYVIAIIPTILGNGRRLFKGDYSKLLLHLDKHTVSDGIPVMTYSRRNS